LQLAGSTIYLNKTSVKNLLAVVSMNDSDISQTVTLAENSLCSV